MCRCTPRISIAGSMSTVISARAWAMRAIACSAPSSSSVAMLDLLIRNASLPDGRAGIDIAVQGEHITEVGPNITAQSVTIIEAGGQLVSPPFVDAHFHM